MNKLCKKFMKILAIFVLANAALFVVFLRTLSRSPIITFILSTMIVFVLCTFTCAPTDSPRREYSSVTAAIGLA